MAGLKLTARAQEEVDFLTDLLRKCDHLGAEVEKYAAAKRGADMIVSQIARELGHIRQNAMIKNLGPIADQAGLLSVAAGRGSQVSRSRTMREGIAGFKQLLERTMKATIDADQRQQAEKAREQAKGAH
jgi:hypothetical protein